MGSELKLEPCPFCKGKAEMDLRRGYAPLGLASGLIFNSAVIYCLSCGAEVAHDCEDTGNLSDDELDFIAEELAAAWNTRSPSRNDVLEEAAKVADQEMLRAKAEVETYETGCAYRTAALAEMGLAARFAQSIRALKDRDT